MPVVEDEYEIGTLTARNLQDTVTIGGVPQTMDIDAATKVSWNSPFDGIIGLSFSNGDVAPSSYVDITKQLARTSGTSQLPDIVFGPECSLHFYGKPSPRLCADSASLLIGITIYDWRYDSIP